jgi:hypothetical protein
MLAGENPARVGRFLAAEHPGAGAERRSRGLAACREGKNFDLGVVANPLQLRGGIPGAYEGRSPSTAMLTGVPTGVPSRLYVTSRTAHGRTKGERAGVTITLPPWDRRRRLREGQKVSSVHSPTYRAETPPSGFRRRHRPGRSKRPRETPARSCPGLGPRPLHIRRTGEAHCDRRIGSTGAAATQNVGGCSLCDGGPAWNATVVAGSRTRKRFRLPL